MFSNHKSIYSLRLHDIEFYRTKKNNNKQTRESPHSYLISYSFFVKNHCLFLLKIKPYLNNSFQCPSEIYNSHISKQNSFVGRGNRI